MMTFLLKLMKTFYLNRKDIGNVILTQEQSILYVYNALSIYSSLVARPNSDNQREIMRRKNITYIKCPTAMVAPEHSQN